MNNHSFTSDIFLIKGDILIRQNKLDLALEKFMEANNTSKQLGNKTTQLKSNRQIINVYKKQNKYDNALTYAQKAITLTKSKENSTHRAEIFNEISELFNQLNKSVNQSTSNEDYDKQPKILSPSTLSIFVSCNQKYPNHCQ